MHKTKYLQTKGTVSACAASNIAIVKYWGKTDIQIPVNPSLSFTLNNAITKTNIKFHQIEEQDSFSFDFFFESKRNKSFETKLQIFLDRVVAILPWLKSFHLQINSSNTFPHSSGIASSASSYAALSIALSDINSQINGTKIDVNIISEMARLGSGSACRSTHSGWNTWGESDIIDASSNRYASPITDEIHPSFLTIHDSILLVSKKEKSVSSTAGHQLMENHPYKDGRIAQAHSNLKGIKEALKEGDWAKFIEITELEALSLHGLMMSSTPSYSLLEPNSLEIIQRIRAYRAKEQLDICFTIDAGPNIHVLYPESNKKQIREFIDGELRTFCSDNTIIHDQIAKIPQEI